MTRPALETRRGPGARARAPRFASLDVSRGLILIVQICVISVLAPVPGQLRHAAWFGVTFFDLVFPVFVTLSGIGLAFAYRRRSDVWVTTRRVVVLCLVGLLYTALLSGNFDPTTLRLTGVLQLYAVLVLVSALLHTMVRSARGWALITVGAALVSTVFFLWWESRCAGVLSPECNPSGFVDELVFGDRMYRQGERGHDPEGLVAICGAFITASAGTTAGHVALRARSGSVRRGLVRLGLWVMTCAGLGALLGLVVEPFKRLWTPSFALLTASLGLILFTLTLTAVDGLLASRAVPDDHVLTRPLIALGRNSLLVYFGSHFVAALLQRAGEPSLAERLAQAMSWLGGPRVGYLAVGLAFWWTLTIILHRHRIYVRP